MTKEQLSKQQAAQLDNLRQQLRFATEECMAAKEENCALLLSLDQVTCGQEYDMSHT